MRLLRFSTIAFPFKFNMATAALYVGQEGFVSWYIVFSLSLALLFHVLIVSLVNITGLWIYKFLLVILLLFDLRVFLTESANF